MNNEKSFTFRLPAHLYEGLLRLALTNGNTASDVARNIIQEHLRVEAILSKLDELDIARRFRELYAQARITNHSLDALAHTLLGDKYNAWITEIKQSLKLEAENKKKNEEVTTR